METQLLGNTLSITFKHPPPNSARTGYTTEGALFISVQLSADVVSALRKAWVLLLIRLWNQHSSVSIQTILVLFVLAYASWSVIKETSDINYNLSVKNLLSKHWFTTSFPQPLPYLISSKLLLFEHYRKTVC